MRGRFVDILRDAGESATSEFSRSAHRDLDSVFLRRPRRRAREKREEERDVRAAAGIPEPYTRTLPTTREREDEKEKEREGEKRASRASHFAEFTIMLGTGRIRGNYSRYFRSRAFLLATASHGPAAIMFMFARSLRVMFA